ncbi:hypothetical protein [Streptomyces sp. NPDC047014]|uniref:hypothetical protein n=1 Tax=Streptomyces sp. NPDC047014 TaxID=3155736 RepID=UPI003405E7F0
MTWDRDAPAADPASSDDEVLTALEITTTECRQCGTLISGLNGRYACPLCGWVNHHSEGHAGLPTAQDDLDHTPRKPSRRSRR